MTRRRRRGPSGGADTRALAEAAAREAADRRGQDVVVLDLRGLTSATDYFVIASGESDVQVKAIAARIEERLEKDNVRPWHVEGLQNARWILLDYVDFVVHVFHKAARRYYELERLWADAPSASFEPRQAEPPAAEADRSEALGERD
ncbi:MAG TPA: ribosome silencing factor [Candidatus Polarisedimenticolia bacterium]|nr:ribosome silencing factor [Candidatus Polarisedimenticolia bacterium]